MRFPDELYNIIKKYKREFEQREGYEKMLSVFASAIIHKPEMNMLSRKEARQAFVRLFPQYRRFIRYVAKDLEQFLGPPVNIGDEIKVWFMLNRPDSRFPLFPPYQYLTEYYNHQVDTPEPPEHTAV